MSLFRERAATREQAVAAPTAKLVRGPVRDRGDPPVLGPTRSPVEDAEDGWLVFPMVNGGAASPAAFRRKHKSHVCRSAGWYPPGPPPPAGRIPSRPARNVARVHQRHVVHGQGRPGARSTGPVGREQPRPAPPPASACPARQAPAASGGSGHRPVGPRNRVAVSGLEVASPIASRHGRGPARSPRPGFRVGDHPAEPGRAAARPFWPNTPRRPAGSGAAALSTTVRARRRRTRGGTRPRTAARPGPDRRSPRAGRRG